MSAPAETARQRYDRLKAELDAIGQTAMTERTFRKVWEWQQTRLELADELGLSAETRAWIRNWLQRVKEPYVLLANM